MKKFSYTKTDEPSGLKIQVSGEINQDFSLSPSEIGPADNISFDLSNVRYINSQGIQKWLLFIKDLESKNPQSKFKFSSVSAMFMNSLSMVSGMLPAKSRIDSAFVPYICVDCSDEKSIEISRNSHFGVDAKSLKLPTEKCKKCGGEMEADVANRYFEALWKFHS